MEPNWSHNIASMCDTKSTDRVMQARPKIWAGVANEQRYWCMGRGRIYTLGHKTTSNDHLGQPGITGANVAILGVKL